jgi:aryl-alcohol dehydrogenase-like predicted oxidoreductase
MYLIHEPDPETPLDETLRALDDCIHQGKVLYIGASNMPGWLMTKALWISDKYNLHRFEWVQNSYSLLDRGDEQTMLPLCADQHLGYTPFSPLAGGWLTGKYRSSSDFAAGSRMSLRPEPYQRYLNAETFEGLEQFAQAAKQHGVSMSGLALAWIMGNPLVTSPIIGPRKIEHLVPVQEALSLQLIPDERDTLTGLFPHF